MSPDMAGTPKKRSSLSGRRYSASNEASRDAERQRILGLTPYERAKEALELGRRRKTLSRPRRSGR